MADRIASHGRGGAGNLGKDDPNSQPHAEDLTTPTLKSDHYSTGRGGSGNIAKNDPLHPELARASQDVEAPQHREQSGPTHFGRGGAANVITPGTEQSQLKGDEAKHTGDNKGLVGKGKEFLNKLGKK
ncbi:hypothetical protein EJ04DRAFT_210837 [Polyplosphaeria fusca]|uniref:Uncharacterized protein n=1 Tax=Polyplosphaeria fusca TaxID=682080 RepID=A0A9P4RBH4_9PLEO|nr:hypothetical protein EJ04DRAFT_210837 [Polyplosphaeria fusca]